MDLGNKLLNELVSKDKNLAAKAASAIINNKDVNAFVTLIEKSDYLFDYVKNNISQKLINAINEKNYKNILNFISYYSPDYEDFIVNSLVKYANEDLTDELSEILEKEANPYCALYFSKIPDTIALQTLQSFFDTEDEALLTNCAKALGVMKDEETHQKALELLDSNDEFEVLKGVKFLVNYNDKNILNNLFNTMYKSAFGENIALEIAYFKDLRTILNDERALDCFDIIISSLGEIVPLQSVFDLQIYETLADLMQGEISSHAAKILLKAKLKFDMFNENSQYTFDEDKNTKNEIAEISNLLTKISNNLIQKSLEELDKSEFRIISELQLIKELKPEIEVGKIASLLSSENEIIVCEAAQTLSELGKTAQIENKEQIIQNLKDENIKAIVQSYFS